MAHNFVLVAHPKEVYHSFYANELVCLTRQNPRRKSARNPILMANQNGPETRLQSRRGLTETKDKFVMADDQDKPRAPGVHTHLHKRLIQRIVDETGASTKGFHKAVDALAESLGSEVMRAPFVPDAYRINFETCRIEIYEVEVTSMLTINKIIGLGSYWFDWDCEGGHDWLPVLFIVNRYGGIDEIDLMHAYHMTGPFEQFAPALYEHGIFP